MSVLRFSDWSIRRKVLAVLFVAAILPLPVIAYLNYRFLYQKEEERYKDTMKARGDQVREQFTERHVRFLNAAGHIARLPQVIAFASDPGPTNPSRQPILDLLALWAEDRRAFYGIGIVNLEMTVVLATTGQSALDEKRFGVRQLEGKILDYRFVRQALAGEPVVSDLHLLDRDADLDPDSISGRPEDAAAEFKRIAAYCPAIAYAYPVRDKAGLIRGAVVVWANAEQAFWKPIALENNILGDESYITLFDKVGVRIANSRNAGMLFHPGGRLPPATLRDMVGERRFGRWTEKFLDGDGVLEFPEQFTRARMDGLPDAPPFFRGYARANARWNLALPRRIKTDESGWWTFFFMVPERNITGPVRSLARELFSFGCGLILVTAAAAMLLAGHILKPVRALAKSMKAFAGGDLRARVPESGGDELGRLGGGFNAMAEQLERTVKSLNEALAARALSEARTRAIMDTAADGIITTNPAGVIESTNLGVSRVFHYAPQELVGRNLSLLFPAAVGGPGDSFPTRLAEDSGVPHETEGRRKDGSSVPVEINVGEVRDGAARSYTVTVHDLTLRRRTEQQLRAARDEAERANRTKSRFLANMSHELRTPLNAVIGYSELLQEIARDEGRESFLPDLQKIVGAGKHLVALINDILDFSKMEAEKLTLFTEAFDLEAMVRDAAVTIRPVVEKNGNTFDVHCDGPLGTVRTDKTRLRQCLFNLLSNAGKFTNHGAVSLHVGRKRQGDRDWVYCRVDDTGVGMTPQQCQSLFQAFTRIETPETDRLGGTGLGLAISLRLSQLMGGTIRVQSEAGKGSCFTLEIPAEIDEPAAAAMPGDNPGEAAPADKRPDAGPTVLAVDDDAEALDLLTRVLTGGGFRVVTASRGRDAVAKAKEVRPQVITLDVIMPECDGWSVLSALKADPETAAIPVLMLTVVDDRNLGLAMGASDYFTKPLDRQRLLLALKKHCRPPSRGLALVVEDDASTREVLRRMLEKGGWAVEEAANGREALDHAMTHKPGLILLDLMMPEMDGFEFLTEVSRHPEWHEIPVIVVTAKNLTPADRSFLSRPPPPGGYVRQVLQKGSFNRDDLLRSVRDLVGSPH